MVEARVRNLDHHALDDPWQPSYRIFIECLEYFLYELTEAR